MALNTRLTGILDWLREGYPAGVPPKDYIPLLALLRRRAPFGRGARGDEPCDPGRGAVRAPRRRAPRRPS